MSEQDINKQLEEVEQDMSRAIGTTEYLNYV